MDEAVVGGVRVLAELAATAREEDVEPVLLVRVVGRPAALVRDGVVTLVHAVRPGVAIHTDQLDVDAEVLLPLGLQELGGGLAGGRVGVVEQRDAGERGLSHA